MPYMKMMRPNDHHKNESLDNKNTHWNKNKERKVHTTLKIHTEEGKKKTNNSNKKKKKRKAKQRARRVQRCVLRGRSFKYVLELILTGNSTTQRRPKNVEDLRQTSPQGWMKLITSCLASSSTPRIPPYTGIHTRGTDVYVYRAPLYASKVTNSMGIRGRVSLWDVRFIKVIHIRTVGFYV